MTIKTIVETLETLGKSRAEIIQFLLDDANVAQHEPATAHTPLREMAREAVTAHRRKRSQPSVRRVVYHVVNRRNRGADLTPTPRKVYTWLLSQRADVSAQDVEKGLNLRRKQVESALYSLRTTGHVVSVEAE